LVHWACLFLNFICGDPVLAETFFFLTGPWAKGDTGGFFKAALLSGPPGVGKYLFDLSTQGRGCVVSQNKAYGFIQL
jgi:hypothetical protein